MNSKRQGCACEKCQECCRREPGWFMPEEVSVAAKFLGIKENDFIAKYCKEHPEDAVLAYSPATKPKSTECVFLDASGLCKIHPVKPYECRKVYGCGPLARHQRIREIIKKKWG